MTTEQKAKAYEEALDKIKPLYEQAKKDGNPIWSTYEYLFSELEESDDERIRKTIVTIVEQYARVCEKEGDPCEASLINDALIYLEKHKEQKSLNISAASEWLRKHVCIYMNSEYNEFHKCVEYDGSIDKERLVNDFEEAMQKEQKPLPPFDELTPEEKMNHPLYLEGFDTGREVQKVFDEPKPAEWSEEEEKMLRTIISDGSRGVELDSKQISWLKSLRPQSKPEWNEDDEAMKNDIIDGLKNLWPYDHRDRCIAWLKSFQPQAKQVQPEQKSEAKLTGWAMRGINEEVWVRLDRKSFPDLKDEPVEVEVTIRKKNAEL